MKAGLGTGQPMYGWRARVGLIIPHVNMTLEPEINKIAPDGVSVHAARMVIPQLDADGLVEMGKNALNAASQLAEIDADIIAFGCTSGSFVGDREYEQTLVAQIAERAGCPAISTTGASVEALRTLGVSRIAVATPYDDSLNAKLTNFLTVEGMEVVNIVGLGLRARSANFPISRNPVSSIAQQSHETVYRLARSAVLPNAQALFISCTNLPTIDLIKNLENDLGIPVVTASQATIWSAFRQAGLGDMPKSLGALSEY